MLKIFDTPYYRKRYNFEDRNAFVFCWLILFLPIVAFCVFFVYVNIDSIIQAFYFVEDGKGSFGLGNFLLLFNEMGPNPQKTVWNILEVEWKSIQLWLIGWLFWFPGVISNYVLFKRCWGHYVFRVIFMIPGVLGGIVTVLIYKNMTNVGGPIYNLVENAMGKLPTNAEYMGLLGDEATAWYTLLGLRFLPGIVGFNLVQTGAYARIPTELNEVGRIDGLGFIGEFWQIAIPLTWSTMQIGFITTVAGMLMGDCGVFLYTKGQHNTATMGFYMYWQTYLISGQGNADLSHGDVKGVYGFPAALGFFMTMILVPASIFTRKLCNAMIEEVTY